MTRSRATQIKWKVKQQLIHITSHHIIYEVVEKEGRRTLARVLPSLLWSYFSILLLFGTGFINYCDNIPTVWSAIILPRTACLIHRRLKFVLSNFLVRRRWRICVVSNMMDLFNVENNYSENGYSWHFVTS